MSTSQPSRKVEWLVWGGLLVVIASIFLIFLITRLRSTSASGRSLPVYGQVSDFTLTNQNGRAVGLASLHGHPWLADIIFTRCAGPCLKMTHEMQELQDSLPSTSRVRLVSLTTDPGYDSPPVLKAYAQRFGNDPQRWMFLTGSKSAISNLAVNSLKLTAIEKTTGQRENDSDLFIHSTIFVLVDGKGRLRAVYESTGEGVDLAQVKKDILADALRLERE